MLSCDRPAKGLGVAGSNCGRPESGEKGPVESAPESAPESAADSSAPECCSSAWPQCTSWWRWPDGE